jgi:dTDP-4-amino-4,6-dideoxygalactose transaminase
MINVTKTYLPPFDEYTAVLKRAWDKAWITNNGELVIELENKLKEYLGVDHLLFCSNGTIVLQMALKALDIKGDVITTPFSYVATTNAILWENCKPVFADIRSDDFCIDAGKIEAAITERTQAILATHVYGFPCDVDKIEKIAVKYNLKVIYDGAHAFGCGYKGKSLLSFGDIATCSFHATKIFHTVEGGAIICNNKELLDKLYLYRSFGHIGDNYYTAGINGKNSEFHAAMGLCILPKMDDIIAKRKHIFEMYGRLLGCNKIVRPFSAKDLAYNYAYCPVLFETEEILLKVKTALAAVNINTRRYFYPSLNALPFIEYQSCKISDEISKRVLCLPFYDSLSPEDVEMICGIVTSTINQTEIN